jgi:hypothetical protein
MNPEIRQLHDLENEWDALATALAVDGQDKQSKAKKVRIVLRSEGSFALYARGENGASTGALVAERRKNPWIVREDVAFVRFFRAPDHSVERALLDEAACAAKTRGATHLAIERKSGSEALSRCERIGFSAYMTTLHATMPAGVPEAEPPEGQDGVRIRYVEDLDADWARLWPLLDAYERFHASVVGGTLLDGREERSRQELTRHWATTCGIVAEADGALIGVKFNYLRGEKKDGRRWGYGNRTFVEPAYRRLGIGSRMEGAGMRWFHAHGVTHIEDKSIEGVRHRTSTRVTLVPINVELRRAL